VEDSDSDMEESEGEPDVDDEHPSGPGGDSIVWR